MSAFFGSPRYPRKRSCWRRPSRRITACGKEKVESKRLSAALDFIKAQQRERTKAKVAKPATTRRDARLLQAGTPRRAGARSSAETQS